MKIKSIVATLALLFVVSGCHESSTGGGTAEPAIVDGVYSFELAATASGCRGRSGKIPYSCIGIMQLYQSADGFDVIMVFLGSAPGCGEGLTGVENYGTMNGNVLTVDIEPGDYGAIGSIVLTFDGDTFQGRLFASDITCDSYEGDVSGFYIREG